MKRSATELTGRQRKEVMDRVVKELESSSTYQTSHIVIGVLLFTALLTLLLLFVLR